jgi:hypothetical protein
MMGWLAPIAYIDIKTVELKSLFHELREHLETRLSHGDSRPQTNHRPDFFITVEKKFAYDLVRPHACQDDNVTLGKFCDNHQTRPALLYAEWSS